MAWIVISGNNFHDSIGLIFVADFSIFQYLKNSELERSQNSIIWAMAEKSWTKSKSEDTKSSLAPRTTLTPGDCAKLIDAALNMDFKRMYSKPTSLSTSGSYCHRLHSTSYRGRASIERCISRNAPSRSWKAAEQRDSHAEALDAQILCYALGSNVDWVKGGSQSACPICSSRYPPWSEHAMVNNQRDTPHGDSWCWTRTVGDRSDEKQVWSTSTETWHVYWRVQERVRCTVWSDTWCWCPSLPCCFWANSVRSDRYAAMLAQVTNDATLGRAFPQTLHAAWSVASGWKTASAKIAGGSDMQ